MKTSDYIEQSIANLWKKKLRTFLTTFGVVIGIGALVSMFSFGQGIQKNVTERFRELGLFNYINVFPGSEQGSTEQSEPNKITLLDDELIEQITRMDGVEFAFPEIRFPAMILIKDQENFTLIQALPATVYQSDLMKLCAGTTYSDDEPNSLIISDTMLRSMKIDIPQKAIGEQVEIATLTLDLGLFNPAVIASVLQGQTMPFARQSYTFTIVGVIERGEFGGPTPLRSNVYIPIGASEKMKKLSLTSIWDFFQPTGHKQGYSMVGVRVSSIKYIDPVKKQLEELGLKTFAFIDELQEIKKGFLLMDMFLFAIGMIAITVASLGIINTMVMSILERYREIGIMKAVGASDIDVKKIFLFESATIGFLGGVFGLALGWAVSVLINIVLNCFLGGRGVPYIDYFSFPWWLCLGAIAFSILVSLAAGVYPAIRAAKVDPVVALRHD
jgi:putative ABC transport system permease protein